MNKKIIIAFLTIILLVGCSGKENKEEPKKEEKDMTIDEKIDETIKNMTLDEKIGQMIIVF